MDEIRHSGIVSGIHPDRLTVTIVQQTACAACHAKGFCAASDMKAKEIDLPLPGREYSVGQPVTVVLREETGLKALLLGYLLPFLLLLVTLFVADTLTGNEMVAGIAALAILVPYYLGLFLFRGRLKRAIRFELEDT